MAAIVVINTIQITFLLQVNTPQQEASQAVQTLSDNSSNQNTDLSHTFTSQIGTVNLDLGGDNSINTSQMAALPINQNGQIILTNDGQIGGKIYIYYFKLGFFLLITKNSNHLIIANLRKLTYFWVGN